MHCLLLTFIVFHSSSQDNSQVASSYPSELRAATSTEKSGGDPDTPKVAAGNYLTDILSNSLAQYKLCWKKDKSERIERCRLDRECHSAEESPFNDDDADEIDKDEMQLLPEGRTDLEACYARNEAALSCVLDRGHLSGGVKMEEIGSHPPVSESQPASALKRPAVAVYSQDTTCVAISLPTF
jgi:hypothetical protein